MEYYREVFGVFTPYHHSRYTRQDKAGVICTHEHLSLEKDFYVILYDKDFDYIQIPIILKGGSETLPDGRYIYTFYFDLVVDTIFIVQRRLHKIIYRSD